MKIEVKNVTKVLSNTKVLDQIDLTLTGGRSYGFQGINGSGKTMLMRMVSGLIYPTEGQVLIDGKALGGSNSFPENMGLLIENPAFLDGYTGLENLRLLAYIRDAVGREDIETAIRRVGLDPSDKRKYRKYSLGMKQRLGIACAIMEKPDLLILDEPLNSLDEEGIERVRQIVEEEKARGALVIISCHDAEELSAMADEMYRIVAGKLTHRYVKGADGTFGEIAL